PMRRQLVALAVTRQEDRLDAVHLAQQQRRRRCAVGCLDLQLLLHHQARPLVHAGAADHCHRSHARSIIGKNSRPLYFFAPADALAAKRASRVGCWPKASSLSDIFSSSARRSAGRGWVWYSRASAPSLASMLSRVSSTAIRP